MNKHFHFFSVILMSIMLFVPTVAMAQLDETVAIDETNFPDQTFRNYVSKNFDTDKDGYLSHAEIGRADRIDIYNDGVTSLIGVEHLTALTYIYVHSNELASLNLEKNTALTSLNCGGNNITDLNISNCTLLTYLSCEDNQLTHLDLEKHTSLNQLFCGNNVCKLGAVDFTGFAVDGLDMTRVSNVEGATVINGKFVPTDANTTAITYDYDTKYVNTEYPNRKFKIFINSEFSMSPDVDINETNFPDEIFRNYVTQNFDADKNGFLNYAEIGRAKTIDASRSNIRTLVGIEYLTQLKTLYCFESNCTFINLEKNTALTEFYFSTKGLDLGIVDYTGFTVDGLDMTRVSNVEGATVVNGKFVPTDAYTTTITYDYDTKYVKTKYSHRNFKFFISNVSDPTEVVIIDENHYPDDAFRNYVTANIDTDKNGWLGFDEIKQITKIDVSNSGIKSLAGIQYFTALEELKCDNNQLTLLDLEKNTALKSLSCSNNVRNLGAVDFKGFKVEGLDMTRVSNVVGATVEDGYFVPTDKSITTITYDYDTKCVVAESTLLNVTINITRKVGIIIDETNFPDETFRNYVSKNFDTDDDDELCDREISNANRISIYYGGVTSLVGIEHLTALTYIYVHSNKLTSLNLEKNTALTSLNCGGNNITDLNISNCTLLTYLSCEDNQLTHLDLEKHTSLNQLYCQDNVRDLGAVDFNGFAVDGLDMTRVSNVEGATVVNGKFVPTDAKTTAITYDYDTKYVNTDNAVRSFKLVFINAADPIITIDADKGAKTIKTIENGRVVIIRDGKKYDISGKKL